MKRSVITAVIAIVAVAGASFGIASSAEAAHYKAAASHFEKRSNF